MTREESIKNLELILYQFQSSVDEAASEFAEKWQKESLQDNKEAVESLEMAIRTLKDYETISQRLGHLPFRVYEGKEMVDRLDIYDTLNNIGYTAIMGE